MSLQVRLVGECHTVHLWRTHAELEYSAHTDVHVALLELARLHALYYVLYLVVISRFHEVVAGMHLCGSVAQSRPVGHHHTAEPPVVAQDVGEQ